MIVRLLMRGYPALPDIALGFAMWISRTHLLQIWGTLTQLGEHCRSLQKIDLQGRYISDIGLRKIAEGCSRLD